MKLKPGLGASYTIRPGNRVGLFYSLGPTRGIRQCNRPTCTLGQNAAAVGWVDHPVVVLDCMKHLNDGAHTTNVTVYLCVVDELI